MKSQTHGKSTEPLSIQSQPVAACVSILCFEYGSTPNWKTFRLDRIPKRIIKEASGGTGLLWPADKILFYGSPPTAFRFSGSHRLDQLLRLSSFDQLLLIGVSVSSLVGCLLFSWLLRLFACRASTTTFGFFASTASRCPPHAFHEPSAGLDGTVDGASGGVCLRQNRDKWTWAQISNPLQAMLDKQLQQSHSRNTRHK